MTDTTSSRPASVLPAPDSAESQRRRRWRMLKDRLASHGVALGGVSVIIAIVLIFFYLLYVVLPLFASAEADRVANYPAPGGEGGSLYLAMEEQTEIGLRVTSTGKAVFFNTVTGAVIDETELEIPAGAEVSS